MTRKKKAPAKRHPAKKKKAPAKKKKGPIEKLWRSIRIGGPGGGR